MADNDCADNVNPLLSVTGKIRSIGMEDCRAGVSASTYVFDDDEFKGFNVDNELKDMDDDELEYVENEFVNLFQATLFKLILAAGCKQMEEEKRKQAGCKQMEEEKRGASIKYGLVAPFLQKFPFEDREHVPNSEYYDSSDEDDDSDEDYYGLRAFRPPNAHEVVLKFLKQVRESNGYDVDCCPPPRFFSPFVPLGPNIENDAYRNMVIGAAHFAIYKINVETKKNYVFVKLDNVVGTTCSLILLTFSVKEEGADSELIALRAMLNVPYGTLDYELEEWMFKPPPPSTEK